jgi:hypothetical protein
VSLGYCGRALGTRQRLPGSSPLATFGSTLGRIGHHPPRVYCPWQQSELQWACGTFSDLLLLLAFSCRLASLAAGCVATIASPLYRNNDKRVHCLEQHSSLLTLVLGPANSLSTDLAAPMRPTKALK